MATERLYYTDSYLANFRANILEVDDNGRRIYLDRTAFYPTSGGQPHDLGTMAGAAVTDVIDEGDRIAHLLEAPAAASGEIECSIDWERRFDHMQQHSGQHLLSAVLVEMYGIGTIGFHLGSESSAIDLDAAALDAAQVAHVEARANQVIFENRPLAIAFEDSSKDLGLRKASEREGVLRIISIEGIDRSACGGTHVRATGEIGPILIRKIDKAHGNVRMEFLCGARAVRRAHADYETLAKISHLFSAPPDETPALVAAQIEELDRSEKSRRKLAAEVARQRGRELYESTAPNAAGRRCALQRIARGAIDDELRGMAQGFSGNARAVFLAAVQDPPALMFAVSADAGINAGAEMKTVLGRLGGRGGGNAQVAQGSLPDRTTLEEAFKSLAAIAERT